MAIAIDRDVEGIEATVVQHELLTRFLPRLKASRQRVGVVDLHRVALRSGSRRGLFSGLRR